VKAMIGDWITDDTPVQQIAAFAEKVNLKHDFLGFKGDPRFIQTIMPRISSPSCGFPSQELRMAHGSCRRRTREGPHGP